MRDRILVLSNYVVTGYMSDPSAARGQALLALGQSIEQQPLIAANGDMFAALGIMLLAVSWFVLFARKGLRWPVRPLGRIGWQPVSDDRSATLAFCYPAAAITYPPAVFLYDRASTARCQPREVARHGLRNRG